MGELGPIVIALLSIIGEEYEALPCTLILTEETEAKLTVSSNVRISNSDVRLSVKLRNTGPNISSV